MKITIEAEQIIDEQGGEILETKTQELELEEGEGDTIVLRLDGYRYLVKCDELVKALPLFILKDSVRLFFTPCKD